MYISKVKIRNIKSIKNLELNFEKKPGWHVILGDNGSGKSTILKVIALSILGEKLGYSLDQDFRSWIRYGEKKGTCELEIETQKNIDASLGALGNKFTCTLNINNKGDLTTRAKPISGTKSYKYPPSRIEDINGWYCVAFGSYRRISDELNYRNQSSFSRRVDANGSLFRNDYSLLSAIDWLRDLKFQSLESKIDLNIFKKIIHFFNVSELLPDNVKIEEVTSKGIIFKDASNSLVNVLNMSAGYQSIFAMTVELVRQMSIHFGVDKVFSKKNLTEKTFNLPGLVLIDEVDIHLHPKWQTNIGKWFKKYFPKIQFIITTHSPMVCRSCQGSHIWKLETFQCNEANRMLKGDEFNRLVYGNILDALGTELFGKNITRNEDSHILLEELAKLNMISSTGKITEKQKKRLKFLQNTFTTDDPFEF